jgi:ribosomal protein S18 acetylase RimI-like enzyme
MSGRLANLEDLDRVRPVWQSPHRHHGAIGSTPLQSDLDLSWSIRRAACAEAVGSGDGFVLVVEAADLIVGYVAVVRRGPDDAFPVGARWAEVYSLAVLPEWRSAGIGSMLIVDAEERLAAMEIVDVSMAAMVENTAAVAFYRARGFVAREVVLWRSGADTASLPDAEGDLTPPESSSCPAETGMLI